MSKTEYLAVYTVVIFEAKDESWGEHIREVWKDQNGDIHRDGDEPAIICKNVRTGEIIQREWYQNGLRHRDDEKPALIHNADWGIREEYHVNDCLHRDNGPAIYEKTVDGIIAKEEYYLNGRFHRENGPSCIIRDDDTGVVIFEHFHSHGLFHRLDGAAAIERHRKTGITVGEYWYKKGQPFRMNGGPLHTQRHYLTGEIIEEEYSQSGLNASPSSPLSENA